MLYSGLEQFVGKVTLGDKGVQVSEIASSGNSKWKGAKLDILLKNKDGNAQYLRLFAGANFDTNGVRVPRESFDFKRKVDGKDEQFSIKWEDRFSPEAIKDAPIFLKRTYINGDVRKTFLDEYEFMQFLIEELPNINNKYIKCKGNIAHTPSDKGVTYHEFSPTTIIVLDNDEEIESGSYKEYLPMFATKEDLIFTRDCFDKEILKGKELNTKEIIETYNKKIPIQVYTRNRNTNKATKESIETILVPMTVCIDLTKIDFENPLHLAKAASLVSMFNVKGKGVYSVGALLKYVSGKEEREYTQEEIEEILGKEKLEMLKFFPEQMDAAIAEATGRKQVGERINEIRVYSPCGAKLIPVEEEILTEEMLDLWKLAIRKEETTTTSSKPKAAEQEVKEVKKPDVDSDSFETLF